MQWLYAWSRHTWDAFVEDGPRSQITPRGFKVNNKIKIKDFISFVDVWCVLCALRVSGVLFECVRDGPSQRYRSDLKTKALTEHHIHQKQINGWKRDSYTYYIGIECEPAPKKSDKHILMVCPEDNTFYARFWSPKNLLLPCT